MQDFQLRSAVALMLFSEVWGKLGQKLAARVWTRVREGLGTGSDDRPRDQFSNFIYNSSK